MKTFSIKSYFYRTFACFLLLTVFNIKNFTQPTPSQSQVHVQKCWESKNAINESDNTFETELNPETGKIVVDESSNLLILFGEAFLKSLDYKTGKENWRIDTGGEIVTRPFIQGGGVFVITKPHFKKNDSLTVEKQFHTIRFINKETGITEWTRTIYSESNLYLYGLDDLIFLINQKGKLTAFDRLNGNTLWEKSYPGNLSSHPFFFGDKALLPQNTGFLMVSLTDGKVILQEKNSYPIPKSFSANGNMLFLGSERGFIKGFEIGSKKEKWSYRLGGAVSSINFQKGFILVTSLDNFVYYFSADNGNLIWKKRLAGRIVAQPLILNQAVLILAEGSTTALFLDLSDGKVINQLDLPNDAHLTEDLKKIGEIFAIPTQRGVIAYSFGRCP